MRTRAVQPPGCLGTALNVPQEAPESRHRVSSPAAKPMLLSECFPPFQPSADPVADLSLSPVRMRAPPAAAWPRQSAEQTIADQSAASRDSRRTELKFRECPRGLQLRCRYRQDTCAADHFPSHPAGTQASDKSAPRSH